MASAQVKKFQALDKDQKAAIKDGLSTYMGYLEDMAETRQVCKDLIDMTAKKVEGFSKKEMRKLFNYFKRGANPEELREDAEIIEEVNNFIGKGEDAQD
jgi:hypothetical protein